jgi:hypothetical protein
MHRVKLGKDLWGDEKPNDEKLLRSHHKIFHSTHECEMKSFNHFFKDKIIFWQ